MESVDDFIDLDQNPSKYLIGYRPERRRPRFTRPVRKNEDDSSL